MINIFLLYLSHTFVACSTGSQSFNRSLNLKAIQNHPCHPVIRQIRGKDGVDFSCCLFSAFIEVRGRSWSCFKMASLVVSNFYRGCPVCCHWTSQFLWTQKKCCELEKLMRSVTLHRAICKKKMWWPDKSMDLKDVGSLVFHTMFRDFIRKAICVLKYPWQLVRAGES